MSLSGTFFDVSGDGYERRDPGTPSSENTNQHTQPPKQTVLEALGVKIPRVSVTDPSKQAMGPDLSNLNNPQAQVEMNQNTLATVQQDLQKGMGQISDTIRQAQAQVIEATANLGYSPAELFPSFETTTGPDVMMNAVMTPLSGTALGTKLTGAGSLAKNALGSADSIGTALQDRRSTKSFSDRAAVEAEIEAKLREMSSANTQDTRAEVASAMSFDAAPDNANHIQGFDWNNYFDQGHTLSDIMTINPDHPPQHLVPEFHDLKAKSEAVAEVQDGLERIEHIAEVDLEPNVAPQFDPEEALLLSSALPETRLPVDEDVVASLAESVDVAVAVLEPPKPDIPALDDEMPSPVRPQSGMIA